jgi:Schlafen, AlbA_2
MTIEQAIDTIDEPFLESLIRNQVAEGDTLDYKRDMYGATDGDTKELLRDISAMANNLGGYLLIGVREDNEVLVELVGIEQGALAVERILSSALAGITERIYGLNSRSIPLANGRAVVAVFVPPSSRVPHMVRARDEDRFWIRHGRQKMRMSIEEIRQAYASGGLRSIMTARRVPLLTNSNRQKERMGLSVPLPSINFKYRTGRLCRKTRRLQQCR